MIRGITIKLFNREQTGVDGFNRPIYSETEEEIPNVLVAPTSEQEVLDTLNLTGRKAVYTMAIPKGDTHDWENKTVEFFGQKWRTVGMPISGIESMIPLDWNTKVRVERYGEDESKD